MWFSHRFSPVFTSGFHPCCLSNKKLPRVGVNQPVTGNAILVLNSDCSLHSRTPRWVLAHLDAMADPAGQVSLGGSVRDTSRRQGQRSTSPTKCLAECLADAMETSSETVGGKNNRSAVGFVRLRGEGANGDSCGQPGKKKMSHL